MHNVTNQPAWGLTSKLKIQISLTPGCQGGCAVIQDAFCTWVSKSVKLITAITYKTCKNYNTLSVPHPDPRGNVTAARCSRQLIKRGQEQGRPINEWIIPAHYTHIQISPFTLGFSADYDHRASHPWIIRVLHTWQCGLGLMHVLVSARGTVCSEGWQAWCMEVIES